jgi:hypothetical protein
VRGPKAAGGHAVARPRAPQVADEPAVRKALGEAAQDRVGRAEQRRARHVVPLQPHALDAAVDDLADRTVVRRGGEAQVVGEERREVRALVDEHGSVVAHEEDRPERLTAGAQLEHPVVARPVAGQRQDGAEELLAGPGAGAGAREVDALQELQAGRQREQVAQLARQREAELALDLGDARGRGRRLQGHDLALAVDVDERPAGGAEEHLSSAQGRHVPS